ncbi:MAG TPA: GNAT family N-acetyltransferase [Candidatus Obscuribacterales bacterium]
MDDSATITIRQATKEDLNTLLDININSLRDLCSTILSADELSGRIREERSAGWQKIFGAESDEHTVFILCKNKMPIGFADLQETEEEGEKIAYIHQLYFLPDYLGAGYGSILMEHCKAFLASKNWRRVHLWVSDFNSRAIYFYNKHGFEFDGMAKTVRWMEQDFTNLRCVAKL